MKLPLQTAVDTEQIRNLQECETYSIHVSGTKKCYLQDPHRWYNAFAPNKRNWKKEKKTFQSFQRLTSQNEINLRPVSTETDSDPQSCAHPFPLIYLLPITVPIACGESCPCFLQKNILAEKFSANFVLM